MHYKETLLPVGNILKTVSVYLFWILLDKTCGQTQFEKFFDLVFGVFFTLRKDIILI